MISKRERSPGSATCGKRKHPTPGRARWEVRRMRGDPATRDPETLCHYFCEACGAWHVGHARYEGRA